MLERIARFDFRDGAHWKITWEDTIHTAGNNTLPEIDCVVVRDVFHNQKRLTLPANGALNTGIGQQRADAALLVRQQKHQGCIRICFDDLADHAIRSDHSHIFSNASVLSTVQLNCQTGGSGAHANHTRGNHGDFRMCLPELQQ